MKSFLNKTTEKVSVSVQKATSKPTTRDEEFEELRERFSSFRKSVENIKSEAKKLQDECRTYGKLYVSLGGEIETFFNLNNDDHGRKYKAFSTSVQDAFSQLQAGIGEVVAGTEIMININDGLKKRISHRDELLLEMDVYEKNKDKDVKSKQKYDESVQKYEEVNAKLKGDLRDALRDGYPKFKEHFARLLDAQRNGFKVMSRAAEDLE